MAPPGREEGISSLAWNLHHMAIPRVPPLPPGVLGEALADLIGDPAAPRPVAWRRFPAEPPLTAPFPPWLDPRLLAALARRGITALYAHQADALEAFRRGRHLLVATPTASGKSLCYHLPVLQSLLADPRATALCLFPTKALARQQEAALRALWEEAAPGAEIAAFDGDTPPEARAAARRARALVTNPEMLHLHLLADHPEWRGFWRHLRCVVLDEVHTFSGLWGSHLANLVRRLKRVSRHHGSRPAFLCGSATVAEPADLAARLLGEADVAVIDGSGAPRPERHFLLLDPGPGRDACLRAAEAVMRGFLGRRIPTLAFTRSRGECEVLAATLRARLGDRVAPYRAGYTPAERRALEARLREGNLIGLVSTPALEVGIDLPGLDACLLCGFPGTVAAAWQQAGRAGRGGRPAAALLLLGSGRLDRLFARDPERFFAARSEAAAFDPDNPFVAEAHLRCALCELPLAEREPFGDGHRAERLSALEAAGLAAFRGGAWRWTGRTRPHPKVSLRAQDGRPLRIERADAPGIALGESGSGPAGLRLAPGAIHRHGGAAYRVEEADPAAGRAAVTPLAGGAPPGMHTRAHVALQVTPLGARGRRRLPGEVAAAWGTVRVAVRAPSFRTYSGPGAPPRDFRRSPLPALAMETTGVWLRWPPAFPAAARARSLAAAAPLAAGCAEDDLRFTFQPAAPPDGAPVLTLYEPIPGGAGLAERLFSRLDAWLGLADGMEGADDPGIGRAAPIIHSSQTRITPEGSPCSS